MSVERLVSVFSSGDEDAAIAALTELNTNLLLGSGRLPLAELLHATAARAAQQVSSLGDTLALRAVHNIMSLDTRVCEVGAEHPELLSAVCKRMQQATTAANPDTVDECISMYDCARVRVVRVAPTLAHATELARLLPVPLCTACLCAA